MFRQAFELSLAEVMCS